MNPTDKIDFFVKNTLKTTASPELDQRIDALIAQSANQPARPLNRWSKIMKSRAAKGAIAAMIIISVLMGIYQLTGSIDGASVAWADVVKQFNSITFFNASVYMKENATDEPVQIEIWRNSQKKARIRVDSQVLFGDGSTVVAGFSIDSPVRKIETEEYDEMGMAMIQRLFNFEEFSLDTVIASFGVNKERLKETTPLINPSAMISEDMLVFDIQSDISPEWMRIWVLRESRLPVRIRSWDPRDGDCVDAIMSYSKEQSPEFFDPKAYEKVLLDVQQGGTAGGRANLAYALLKDPGGKNYTPKDLFEKAKEENTSKNPDKSSGYHMPKIEQIGITENGAIWIIASKAQNRMPNGNPFYGFERVTDDLGRKYNRVSSRHWTREDISAQIFVPEDYPFDEGIPKQLTITCQTESHSRYVKYETVGSVDITEWQQDTLWPNKYMQESENDTFITVAYKLIGKNEFDKVDMLAERVRTGSQNEKYAWKLKKLELHKLIHQGNFSEAAELTEKMWLTEMNIYLHPERSRPAPYEFSDYIIAISGNGDVGRATQLWNQLKEAKPDLSKFSRGAQKHMIEDIQRQFKQCYFIPELFSQAKLSLDQVTKIVGFNVLENEDTKWYVPEKYRRLKDPRVIKQEAYKKKLTEYYSANPLEPGQMVLNKCKLDEIAYMGPVPDVKDHYFYVFNRDLHDFLKGYKSKGQAGRVNRVKIADDIENQELHNEIIYNSPEGFQSDACKELVMSEFALEAIESIATETVLVAKYDNSPRKDYRDVRCPAIRGSTSTPGMISYRASGGVNLRAVLDNLATDQEIPVINNTGLDDNTVITQEVANFKTEKGMELAEQWYKENFGITFSKEKRQLPIWIIQKKR